MPASPSKIKAVLKEQGRSVTWLAHVMGMKQPAMSYIILGIRKPKDPAFYEKVAGVLNVLPARILPDPEEKAA